MQQYSIAGLIIEVSGGVLNHIPGFSVFSIEEKEKPDMIINLGETIFDFNMPSIYSFNLEEIPCEFSSVDGKYFFRMIQPDGKHLLTTMHFQEQTLIMATNMSGQVLDSISVVTKYSQEALGASDSALGNVKPDNTDRKSVV